MGTSCFQRVIIVVTAAEQAAANAALAELGGGTVFRAGLSSEGAEPATHYWCNWQLSPDQQDAVIAALTEATPTARVYAIPAADPTQGQPALTTILTELGLTPLRVSGAHP